MSSRWSCSQPPREVQLTQSFFIGTPPMSISRTVPFEPKSMTAVARTPLPSTLVTVPRPYLSWLTLSPTSSSSAGALLRSAPEEREPGRDPDRDPAPEPDPNDPERPADPVEPP